MCSAKANIDALRAENHETQLHWNGTPRLFKISSNFKRPYKVLLFIKLRLNSNYKYLEILNGLNPIMKEGEVVKFEIQYKII